VNISKVPWLVCQAMSKMVAGQLPKSTLLQWQGWNPKTPGTAAFARFAAYSAAITVAEFFELGGLSMDLNHDLRRGYVWVKRKLKRPASNLSVNAFEQVPKRPAGCVSVAQPIQVACLGDSNTKSRGPESYPERLQRLLVKQAGPHVYTVRSFGVSGATAAVTSRCGKLYMSQRQFTSALAWGAQVYVVMLGTNDAWHRGGDPAQVSPGLSDLLASLSDAAVAATTRSPSVFLVLPPGAKAGTLAENLKSIVHPAIGRLAVASSIAQLVDPSLSPRTSYKEDMVHITAQGAAKIAQVAAAAILASRSP